MKLELTIQEMFDRYPGLFKERSDCLNHLFCEIGNGYKWADGELVCIGYDAHESNQSCLNSRLINGKAHQYNKLSLRAEAIHYFNDGEEKEMDEFHKKYFASLPDDVYHKRERKYRWCFYLSGYCTNFAYLFNYPSDIKADWLAGIEECKAMLIEDGYDVEHPDDNPIDTMANWKESIAAEKERKWMR